MLSKQDRVDLWVLGVISAVTTVLLMMWIFWPAAGLLHDGWKAVPSVLILAIMALVEMIRLAQSLTLFQFARRAKNPIPMNVGADLRVAVLTTIVPNKEPWEVVEKTLRAMKELETTNNMTIDVWLLDEGNDDLIKQECAFLDVFHFSRKGIAKYNRKRGPYKARTKHGNHNAWRAEHEEQYDVVAQMDPDHVPLPNFLTRTVGYFSDPDVAFVVAPQVYGNYGEDFIAHGSAVQAYVFHGVIQRGGNGMDAPLLIGTNHLYRPAAMRQIGGYQDCIIEDHLTSMVLYSTVNPESNNRWKGVYTPDILSVGEGPTTFTDYFSQQKRWAYGIWEILRKHSPRMFPKMEMRQRATFAMLQSFYPTVALSWLLSNIVTVFYLTFGTRATETHSLTSWAILWLASMSSTIGMFLWMRKFNLVKHERKDSCLSGMLLLLMCTPVYFSAAWSAVFRRPLHYAVTAKGNLVSPDSLRTFRPHLIWAALASALIAASFTGVLDEGWILRGWTMMTVIICLSPVGMYYYRRHASAHAKKVEALTEENDELDAFGLAFTEPAV